MPDRASRPRRGRAAEAVGFRTATAAVTATAATAVLLLAGSAGPGGPSAAAPSGGGAVGAAAAPADPPDPGRVLQIVAHPDDDLYFMNPDLRYSIAAGRPVTSVYLTSGEADGVNAGAAEEATTPPDKAAYADRPDSLHGLWDGRVPRLESMFASGSPVRQGFTYTKDQVVRTLVGILERYGPTTVRSQDPTPGRFPDTKRYTDHQDHFYGARFVQVALGAYARDVKDRPHFAVQNYLGYFNGSLPGVLDPGEAGEKLDVLDTYAWTDRSDHCGSAAGCGDLKVADHPAGNHWSSSINYARGTSTSWLASDAQYGLWAFKVLDGRLAVWHRAGLLGAWSGPRLLPDAPGTLMDQGISTVTLGDGRIAVFGTRTSFGAGPGDYRREVVHAVQKGPGSEEFGDWAVLGTPETSDEDWTSDISAPAVALDGSGQLAVYVRDGSYTLRGRVRSADGGWGPWEKYGGADLHGSPAAGTDSAGRRIVLAATARSVLGWAQPEAGAPLGPATETGLPETALPITAQGRGNGVRLWLRKPGSGNVRTALVTADGGLKASGLTDVGGLSGFGAVTASGHLLAGRTSGGRLGADVGWGRVWERAPLMFVGAPSSTMTGTSTVSLAVLGLDARLYVTSAADAPDAHLAPWQPVGPPGTAP
ncbi:PIG-L family deacetylase [Streptomyces sp. NBC_00096]|uniref:PIG-L family deacetylase n=1 Tax=Streptomyces sp. NBC_00096 TaxID=2975650 RepID=UPI00324B54A7